MSSPLHSRASSRSGGDPMDGHGLVASVRSESRKALDAMKQRGQKKAEVRMGYLEERRQIAKQRQQAKLKQEARWKAKTERSPFLVDLLAEQERIDEDNRMRLKEEARRAKLIERKKEQVKNEIILKALAEASDLEALREEKRQIALEEKRLKALLDLEKAKLARKADLQAAQRAERHRRQAKVDYRRTKYAELQRKRDEEEAKILMEKHDVEPTRDPTLF